MRDPYRARPAACLALVLGVLASAQSAPTAASRPDRRATLTGDVTTADGKPTAGARVHLIRWSGEGLPMRLWLPFELEQTEIAATVTDAAGRYQFMVEPGRTYGVWAEHGDTISAAQGATPAGAFVPLRLEAGRWASGRIVTGSGGRVTGAAGTTATAYCHWQGVDPDDPHAPRWPVAWLRVTTADGDGRYRLLLPATASSISASLTVAGARLSATAAIADGTDTEIVLRASAEPKHVIRGQLVDRVTGAAVVCDESAAAPPPPLRTCAATDAKGCFTLPSGRMHLFAPAQHEMVHVHGDADTRLRVELDHGVRLTARFLRADGSPLASARVLLCGVLRDEHDVQWATQTDRAGNLVVGCLQRDMPIHGLIESDGLFVDFLDAAAHADIDLGTVRPTATSLVGRVVGPDGGPVAHARVLVRRTVPDADAGVPVRCAFTDQAGWFRLPGVRPGACEVAAVSSNHLPTFATVMVTAGDAPMRLPLAAGLTIRGRVQTTAGEPVAGASIALSPTGNLGGDWARFGLGGAHVRSDAEGRFTVAGLPDTGFRLLAQRHRAGETLLGSVDRVAAGADDLVIVLASR